MTRRTLAPFSLALALSAGVAPAAPPRDAERKQAAPVPRWVGSATRVGPLDPDQPLDRMVLVLQPRDRPALERFLSSQQDPASPDHHRWLTPEQFGARFGAPQVEVDRVVAWLGTQGFAVEEATAGRTAIVFSGRVSQVERAFGTRMALFERNGRPHLANELPASIPLAVSGSVRGLLSLHDVLKRPYSRRQPAYNLFSSRYLSPADFATIYNLADLHAAGIDGSGQKIAVLGRTNIKLDDTRFFRSFFGLPANDPVVVLNGPDPGIDSSSGEVTEANLDVQWSGAVAPKASIQFIVSKSTAVDGVDLSALYAINNNVAGIISMSFGLCEAELEVENDFYRDIWAQAAAQGISVLVASGDTGAAGCDSPSAASGTEPGVNGLCSTPYSTCVGGTEFDDVGSPSSYWNATNDPVTRRSAKGYIPELPWNEARSRRMLGGGGGVSLYYPRPEWQRGPGVVDDGKRGVPDVSVAAAEHTPYAVIQDYPGTGASDPPPGMIGVLGTSASTPALAGFTALLLQKAGGRQGNLNPTLYALGAAQYGGSGSSVYHDITTGDISVPGVTGPSAGPGYDRATGLGSIDGKALLAAWPAALPPAPADASLDVSPGAFTIKVGETKTATVVLRSLVGRDLANDPRIGTVTSSGAPSLLPVTFTPTRQDDLTQATGFLSAGVPVTMAIRALAGASTGVYPIVLTATVGEVVRKATVYVAVGSSSVPAAPGAEVQVPVVLALLGAGGAPYTSDLVAVNRSTSDATVQLRYAPVPGTPGADGPIVARSLPAGRQLYVADAIAYLRAAGYAFPTDGTAIYGTLFVTFAGVSDGSLVYAGSRTSTPNPNTAVGGAFGTFSTAPLSGTATSNETFLYGLKENGAFRSNLAVVHSAAGASSLSGAGPIVVEVQVYDGDTGLAAGSPTVLTLTAGEFRQINSVLTAARAGLSNGYARLRRTTGTDRFIAYAVVNDGPASGGSGTSDGSIVVAGGSEGLVPIVLDLPGGTRYRTELALTNPGAAPSTVTLTYTPSTAIAGASGGGTVTTTIPQGRQVLAPDAIAYLRGLGLAIPDDGTLQGGTLLVTGAIAQGRTYSPNPDTAVGGTYGVAYPALDAARRAKTSAFVYGLRQDEDVRSNLAIADARVGNVAAVEYTIEIHDTDSGAKEPALTLTRSLKGGDWTQVDGILARAGISRGYVRVRPSSGSSDFITYGAVNDGPDPGTRTSDGSYLPMVVP